MDPQETWKNLLDAWTGFDWEKVDRHADALLCWLDDGGFPPELESPRELGLEFNTTVVRAACAFARRRATSVLDDPHHIPQGVPFTLTCSNCNNEGPDTEEEARREGWEDISYVPTSLSEDFSGLCPTCQVANP